MALASAVENTLTLDVDKQEITVPDLGVTLRRIFAVAAQGLEQTGRRKWTLIYKGANVGAVQVKDKFTKGNSHVAKAKTSRASAARPAGNAGGLVPSEVAALERAGQRRLFDTPTAALGSGTEGTAACGFLAGDTAESTQGVELRLKPLQ